jgi:hypothetical protein
MEFVEIGISSDGNHTTQSKHGLLCSWPKPKLVWDVASFVGFLQFYCSFIPFFEVRAEPLRKIMKHEYTEPVGPLWTPTIKSTFEELCDCMLTDPVLKRYDHCKLTILRTDFSAKGFDYVVCQPGNNNVSMDLVSCYMLGQGFNFLTKTGLGTLHPVAFGSHRCQGNKKQLHSYLREVFAGNWRMNKNRHRCFDRKFVWVTDYYMAQFMMTYEGSNPAVLRIQMHLMGWDVAIVHHTNNFLIDADYWSQLDADLCYDPLFKEYLHIVSHLHSTFPVPSKLPMQVANMPYYCGPHIHCNAELFITPTIDDTPSNAQVQLSLFTDVTSTSSVILPLSIIPVRFGTFDILHILKTTLLSNTTPSSQPWPFGLLTLRGQFIPSTQDISLCQSGTGTYHLW